MSEAGQTSSRQAYDENDHEGNRDSESEKSNDHANDFKWCIFHAVVCALLEFGVDGIAV